MDPIFRHTQAHPRTLALRTPTKKWSYGDLNAVIANAVNLLGQQDIGEGTRVALRLPTGMPLIILLWALWRRRAIAVPISGRVPSAEWRRQVRHVGCTVLITEEDDAEEGDLRVFSPETFLQKTGVNGRPEESASLADGQRATIVFTSGSTGAPKAALHAWGNHRYSAKGANANLPLGRGDRWLLSLPLYHVGGVAILVRCALAGAAVAVPAADQPLHEALQSTQASHVSLVATQLRRLLDASTGAPPAFLRAVLLGGGPIPSALLRRGHERGWPLLTSYGNTEMGSQVTTTAPGDALGTLHTAGRRLPHRQLRIVDGEIQVKGTPLFEGYVTTDDLEDPCTDEGWYHTGDRGRIDASGRLHVLGRIDRMFVSGGENIQPEEIESALEELEEVERAIVVPVPSSEFGHRPVAFVRGQGEPSPSALADELRRVLPGFKIPDAFHSLPPSVEEDGLKVDRSVLRERAQELH